MKYKTIIETDDIKGFKFFEDGNGKYIVGKDAGAENDEWIALYFTECKQEPKWILTSDRLPNKSQWVLVTTEERQKPIEIMCYQGIRIGKHDVGNGWEEYEYPSWTSGHGDIQGHHPKAWMPLPEPYELRERSE